MKIMLKEAFAREPRLGRFICHLRQRISADRLNLVTGAGVSMDAGIPSWQGLLGRLSERDLKLATDVKDHIGDGLHPEYLGQIIYLRHKKDWDGKTDIDFRDAQIEHDWAEAIHAAIYQEVDGEIDDIVSAHPYLSELRDLAQKLPLVINFNFDDLLADSIGRQISQQTAGAERATTVVWTPPLVDRPKTTTIYHVNGLLPRDALKKRSPQLIFTEDSFAAALAHSPGISGEYLFLRFVQNTMLIVGHSLGDSSLKNYLRLNKEKRPANHHYHIHWIESPTSIPETRRQDIFQANLELYNLITIFLTSSEIKEFLCLLSRTERDVRDFLDRQSPERRSSYHFYIVGPVAAGKSTLIEQLRCFGTFEEWTRPPPKLMYRSASSLTGAEQDEIDNFLYDELKEKNRRMDEARVGFHFMDRAPLDLYAFSKDEQENKEKTQRLKEEVMRDKRLKDGAIIFVTAKGVNLVKRNMKRGRVPQTSGDTDYLESQSAKLQDIYKPSFRLDTDDLDAGEIAKRVARLALLEESRPADLAVIMGRYT